MNLKGCTTMEEYMYLLNLSHILQTIVLLTDRGKKNNLMAYELLSFFPVPLQFFTVLNKKYMQFYK